LDGIKPGLSARLMTRGVAIAKIRGIARAHGEPERVHHFPAPPGSMCMVPWKTAQETLADEVPDQSALHWGHAFLDYTVVEVSNTFLAQGDLQVSLAPSTQS
jgi:hypothetical protein